MGLLRTIAIIVFCYYAFKFLAKLFAPFLIKKAAETIKKKAEQQYGGGQQQEPQKNTVPEGKTVIDKTPGNQQQSKNSVGEYVDFEEID
ncbi:MULTISPECIES: DUF4834 family protein [Polaribacter]|jgi:hypothetical protein|uniref:DUF4834 domain-containing protein n=1 Tax=Polaribacter sejongensis TaxID=985043 RepID=A0AAJ1QWE9_9FLAO|nr:MULTISPECIES: DUF4834 family protein [Polaribacter]AUC22391.1 DUF4834 domain-containing protein [Polaribacter sejongensis]MDN3619335.1 DUF4834 family protein [Polaribacter undariae]QXP64651.1 DUF4834 family protein [Polaribacter sp. HaHaR_3_91]QXP67147.1 DUF4834 family protein [Polaribacter sp. AHE13PA]QXP69264.1 DUF4834 family protein [Polaribacter sp. R2A056_3_33]